VVLVHGTFANMGDNWAGLAPTLANAGYCVFALTYGDQYGFIGATGPVAQSVGEVAAFVDQVRATTGSATVDLIGHSQGGLVVEYYTKFFGTAKKVHAVVALSPTTHGTTESGLATISEQLGILPVIGLLCLACSDQTPHSAIVTALNSGPVAVAGVHYTVVETTNETAVTPAPQAAFIAEPGVNDVLVQTYRPASQVDHAGLAYDNTTWALVMNALDPAHPGPVGC
jgi:triacylglycerol esterase/lipase EstA (alpha/beta hydrolase family)